MENLNIALLLMIVGMATVFAIMAVPGNIMAAISAAVTVVTQGKGKVAKVEKI